MKVVDPSTGTAESFEDVDAFQWVENLQNQKELGHPYIESTTVLSDRMLCFIHDKVTMITECWTSQSNHPTGLSTRSLTCQALRNDTYVTQAYIYYIIQE